MSEVSILVMQKKTTELKMLSLIKEKDDIIFVSNTRLNTEIQKCALNNLEKKLQLSGYDCFFNSETSNRGRYQYTY